ncbi:MAG: hypothetical protein ACE10O_02950, partial [Candidatus Acidiferrales bacterium]
MGATYVIGFGALAGTTKPGMLRALRRALRRLGRLRLRDLGLNRDACYRSAPGPPAVAGTNGKRTKEDCPLHLGIFDLFTASCRTTPFGGVA